MDWKKTLAVAAPALATALGGPLAGMATGALCAFFGLKTDSKEDDIMKAVQGMSPEQAIKLKQIDLEFKAKMEELNVEWARIGQQDRDSARKMAMDGSGIFQIVLTCLVIGLLCSMMVIMCMGFLSDSSEFVKQNYTLVMGQVLGWVQVAIAFYFGSNMGSKTKDDTIRTLSEE